MKIREDHARHMQKYSFKHLDMLAVLAIDSIFVP